MNKLFAVPALCAVTMCATGCQSQATIAALLSVVGSSVATLESIQGNTALSQKIQQDTAVAVADVNAWKSGSPTQDVIAALNLVEDDLSLLPVSTQDQALIALAITAVEGILAALPASAAVSAPIYTANARIYVPKRPVAAVTMIAPKNAKEFTKRWNAEIVKQPILAAARIF